MHHVERGEGRPVLVLHGAGVDHREAEACFEPALAAHGGLRRVYPDLPGAGQTPAPAEVGSADDVLDLLLDLAERVSGQHSGPAGARATWSPTRPRWSGSSTGRQRSRGPPVRRPVLVVAGHALPHEQPELLGALLQDWLTRTA